MILIMIYFNKDSIRMLNFLKRNLKFANETTKTSAYCALVRPHLGFI